MWQLNKIISFAALMLLAACSNESAPAGQDVVAKVTANSGRRIAYLTRAFAGGGATGDTVYSVYISGQPKGQLGESVMEAVHSCAIKLEWKGEDVLAVNYDGAACDVVRFKNYWYDPLDVKSNQQAHRVEIVLLRNP
jgi:uncharacterized protein YcfL